MARIADPAADPWLQPYLAFGVSYSDVVAEAEALPARVIGLVHRAGGLGTRWVVLISGRRETVRYLVDIAGAGGPLVTMPPDDPRLAAIVDSGARDATLLLALADGVSVAEVVAHLGRRELGAAIAAARLAVVVSPQRGRAVLAVPERGGPDAAALLGESRRTPPRPAALVPIGNADEAAAAAAAALAVPPAANGAEPAVRARPAWPPARSSWGGRALVAIGLAIVAAAAVAGGIAIARRGSTPTGVAQHSTGASPEASASGGSPGASPTPTPTPTAPPAPAFPPGREGAAVAFDPATGSVAVFGGTVTQGSAPTSSNETWLWNGSAWTRQQPPASPPPQSGAASAFDPVSGAFLLVSGPAEGPTADTWSWDGRSWTQLHPATSPPSGLAAMAVDHTGHLLLLVQPAGAAPQTWTWSGSTWRRLAVPGPDAVGPMATDPASGTVVTTVPSPVTGPYDATWTWSGTAWTHHRIAHPAPRGVVAVAFDPGSQHVIAFLDPPQGGPRTLAWNGIDWRQLQPAHTPTFASAAVTAKTHIVLFAGAGAGDDYAQAWIWNGTDWLAAPAGTTSP